MGWFTKKEEEAPKPPPGGTGDGRVKLPALSIALSANDRAFLVTCCDLATPAVATWVDLGIVRRAVLAGISGDVLRLRITDHGPQPYTFRPRAQCVVSFYIQDRLVTFVAYEESTARPDGSCDMLLTMPTQLAVEGRTRYRIPVLPSARLRVTVRRAGAPPLDTDPVDISLAGAMFSFPEGRDPRFAEDQVLDLELAMETQTCRVPFSVRHRIVGYSAVSYGGIFHGAANGFEFARERELSELVMDVERHWVRNRPR
jgi:hypothetical protein